MSALPITAIVYLMSLTPWFDFSAVELITFTIGAVMLIFGIGLFNLGADLAMTPMGTHVGSGLSKQRKLGLLLAVCFVLGMLITIAEPDLQVLAAQVSAVMNGTVLVYAVGLGVGAFLVFAVLRIVFRKHLGNMLTLFYMLLFALSLLLVVRGNESLLPLSFDSGGVTTGPITVPFIMALGVGVSTILGDPKSQDNSFGLVALCSIGPVLAVMTLGIFSAKNQGSLADNAGMVLGLLGISIPNFWMGLMLIIWFSLKIKLFPSGGMGGWKSVVLPAFTLGIDYIASLSRTTRSSMIDVIRSDYLRTARSKGVPENKVINKHALKNALIPIVTVSGTQLAGILGGSVTTETVFSWPGVGRLIVMLCSGMMIVVFFEMLRAVF